MENEQRVLEDLPQELDDKISDVVDTIPELLFDKKTDEALANIKEAWALLPEPKHKFSRSYEVVYGLYRILTIAGKHTEAQTVLNNWLREEETLGYIPHIFTIFILMGENYLYLNQVEEAKEQFCKAVESGATHADFGDQPLLYTLVAHKNIIDNTQIANMFKRDVADRFEPKDIREGLGYEQRNKLEELGEKAAECFENNNYTEVIKFTEQMLSVIPEPKNVYAETHWCERSIGNIYFLQGKYPEALEYFERAKSNEIEDVYQSPEFMLQLGMVYLENKQIENAKECLFRAYLWEGEEVFEEEYLEFLKQNVKLNGPIAWS